MNIFKKKPKHKDRGAHGQVKIPAPRKPVDEPKHKKKEEKKP